MRRIAAQERHEAGRVLLGRRVAGLRVRAGLTSRDLAAAAGISLGYVGLIETGKRLPGLDVLDLIAGAVGEDVAGLIAGVYPWASDEPPEEDPVHVDQGG